MTGRAETSTGTAGPHVGARPTPELPRQRRRHWTAGFNVEEPVRWRRVLHRVVVVSDVLVVLATTGVAIWIGWTGSFAADRAGAVSGLIAAGLMLVALPLSRAWDARVLGTGTTEFKRLAQATGGAVVVLGLGGLTLLVASVRIWVFLLVPLTGVLVAVGRYGLRKWLHHQRRKGRGMVSVLVVGSEAAVSDMVARTRRDPHFGWRIDGACTPTGRGQGGADTVHDVPVVGDLDSIGAAVHERGFRVVSVGQTPGWGPGRLHRLAWELEGTEADLAVDPGLMEIAGPRMHITPVDGLPLLRLSKPRFTGIARALKNGFDRSVAALLLLLAAPVFVTVALAVRKDGGPVFFRQERVGANGRTFRMIKFRSMVVDAEARLAELARTNEAAGPLFKMTRDPRITRVGEILRKYSLDELPQLLNVLNGTMSLVGPRPPLPTEVVTYADDARRRLLVRPGMTGLWQISGRSDLSWEESVRLDLRYVENWSLALDFTILWKTFGAVVAGRGAY